jgi:Raf kinase inhibitor-like YbhB/YbcL family protein
METFTLTSSAFENNGTIPAKYTCDGDGKLSPPLAIAGVPEGSKSLVLIMDDPDIPQFAKEKHGIEVFDHWTVINIPPETTEIPEGATVGQAGLHSAGEEGYTGPCPPPQYEPKEHRYIFVLYALSEALHFDEPPTKQQVLDALAPLALAKATLIGRYSRA